MFIYALIWLSSLLVIVSKYLDCYTTDRVVRDIRQERNPLARWLMGVFGIRTTIWGVFVIVVFAVITANWVLFTSDPSRLDKWSFLLVALIVSFVQFAVVKTNATGRLNPVTRWLIRLWRSGKKP